MYLSRIGFAFRGWRNAKSWFMASSICRQKGLLRCTKKTPLVLYFCEVLLHNIIVSCRVFSWDVFDWLLLRCCMLTISTQFSSIIHCFLRKTLEVYFRLELNIIFSNQIEIHYRIGYLNVIYVKKNNIRSSKIYILFYLRFDLFALKHFHNITN